VRVPLIRALVIGAFGLVSCGDRSLPPRGQLLLHVDTDAPLPPRQGEPGDATRPPALFDRLLVEIFPAGASTPCTGCTREFAVDATSLERGDLSMGVFPPVNATGYRARVKLFRSAATQSGAARPGSTIESVALLPPIAAEGVTDVTVVLRTDDVAAPRGTLDAPVLPEPGSPRLAPWPGAREVPCGSAPEDGEACIPGAAFWMGDPRLDTISDPAHDGRLERLVVVAPFFLDATEVTVAAFRASGLATSLTPGGPSDDPHEAKGDIADCTFTSKPGSNEQRPVNCVSWQRASDYCASRQRTLPSEAQLELVAGGRRSFAFPWGSDVPACGDAVFERSAGDACKSLGVGPANVGGGARDRVAYGGVEVVDVAGNVSEWTRDLWNREDEPCWGTGVFHDPVCNAPSPGDGRARSIRGGAFSSPAQFLRAALRGRVVNETRAVAAEVGFRCARAAR
jgi:formylglycine-generating enzyme required for sulfatase activity